MSSPRWFQVFLVVFWASPLLAQSAFEEDKPTVLKPTKKLTPAESQAYRARQLYAQGCLNEKHNRLIEAIKCFEEASRMDPKSAAIQRSLYPLYIAVDRTSDALDACQKILRLDPEDFQTAFHQARQLRLLDRQKEAIACLELAVKSKRLVDRPDLAAQIWFDLGVMAERENNLENAEKCFRAVTAILDNPRGLIESGRYSKEEIITQAADTWERIGKICLKAKKIPRAIEAYENAKKKDNIRGPRLAYNLAKVYQEQGKPVEALASLEQYLRTLPNGTEGYEMKIALQKKLGRSKDVLPDLENASGRDPNNVALRLVLAREYRLAKKNRLAEPIYAELVKTNVLPEVYRGLFDLWKDNGNEGLQTILTTLDQAIDAASGDDDKRTPDAAAARRARVMLVVIREDTELVKRLLPLSLNWRRKPLCYATRGMLATLAAKTKFVKEAEALYRSCLEDTRRLGGSQESDVYLGLLNVLRAQHKHSEIIEICKLGLKTAQKTSRILFHTEMVFANQTLGRHTQALEAADLAVKEAAQGQQLRCKRIRIDTLVQAGQAEKALTECQALLKEYNHGGDLRDVRSTLSGVYQSLGKPDEAEKQLQLILDSDPNDAGANNDLGYLWADRNKNLPEAERMIRKALELDRQIRNTGTSFGSTSDLENAAYVDSLGWVLFRRGKLEDAREQLEKASRLPGGDDDPVVWDHLGDVYYRLKKGPAANECWKKALQLYDQGTRRKSDGRVKDIKDKLQLIQN